MKDILTDSAQLTPPDGFSPSEEYLSTTVGDELVTLKRIGDEVWARAADNQEALQYIIGAFKAVSTAQGDSLDIKDTQQAIREHKAEKARANLGIVEKFVSTLPKALVREATYKVKGNTFTERYPVIASQDAPEVILMQAATVFVGEQFPTMPVANAHQGNLCKSQLFYVMGMNQDTQELLLALAPLPTGF